MGITTYKIDRYVLKRNEDDITNSLAGVADKSIDLYTDGRHIATSFFVNGEFDMPEASMQGGIIYFYTPNYQYQAVVQRLINRKSVYITWIPKSCQTNPVKGDAYFYDNLFHLSCV